MNKQLFGERPLHGIIASVGLPALAVAVLGGIYVRNLHESMTRIGHQIGSVMVATAVVPANGKARGSAETLAIVYVSEDEILSGPMSYTEAKAEARRYQDADAVLFIEGSPEYQEALRRLQPSVQIATRWPSQ